jgi:TPR repeat protein
MKTSTLIRVGRGALMAAFAAGFWVGTVFSADIARADKLFPAAKSDFGTVSPQASSSSPAIVEKQSMAEENQIEGIRLAAEGGLAHAQFNLGLRYESGSGVAKDPAQALKWFLKAADQGYDEAQYMLGCCYNGEVGFAKDPSEAVKWWKKAAAQGYADAQHLLGLSYFIGEGVPQNPSEAVKWWRKAAEQSHADAQYFLGLSYFNGSGVPRVPEQAAYWLRLAAAQGNENALKVLRQLGGAIGGN